MYVYIPMYSNNNTLSSREYNKISYQRYREKRLAYGKKYRAIHKEEIRLQQQEYRDTHKEEQRKYYYENNKEKRLIYNRNYKLQHKEELKVYQQKYNQLHKEERRIYRHNYYLRNHL